MAEVRNIPYGRQSIDEDDIQAVIDVLKSDYLTTGPSVAAFEKAIADYTGAKYAVAFANGTATLHACCAAAGIGPGDEVIVPPITFVASCNCVLYCGGTPVFADIKADTYNIDPEDVRRKITDKTKAIVAVDLTGQPCEFDELRAIADEYNLTLIEDAAHALGADYKGAKTGSYADMTSFSFHPVKHITTCEGGMVTTNDPELYQKLSLFRTHGITRNPDLMTENQGGWYYQQLSLGYNYRISDVQCALGVSQMKKLDKFVARRRELVDRYNEAFKDVEGLTIPYQAPGCNNSYHLYIIQVPNGRRKEIYDKLQAAGIHVNVHYIPVHTQPYYRENLTKDLVLPNAEAVYENIISLPMFYGLSNDDQDFVIKTLIGIINEK